MMNRGFFFILLTAIVLSSCSSSKLFLKGSAPEAEYTSQVPFSREMRLIIVEVEMDGKPRRFLFDTGAPMVVSEELAAEFDMKVVMKGNVRDSNNQKKKQDYVRMPEFTMGFQRFSGFTAVVVDLDYSPVLACLNIDGIIGANMMSRAFWKIDYEKNLLYFSNHDEFLTEGDALVIPFKTKSSFTPVIDVQLDSTVIKNVTFDTGSGSGLMIGKSMDPNFNPKAEGVFKSYGYHSSGIYGTVADTAYYAQRVVGVGKTKIPEMICTLNSGNGKRILGTAFFEDYDVVINWKQRRAFLYPRSEATMTMRSLGFSMIKREDKLIVSSVTVGSPADNEGLVFGDVITEINGRNCETLSGLDYCEVRSMLEDKDKPVTITVKEKGNFSFTWQKYF